MDSDGEDDDGGDQSGFKAFFFQFVSKVYDFPSAYMYIPSYEELLNKM